MELRVNEGWQKRLEDLAYRLRVHATIELYDADVGDFLSQEEWKRLKPKLDMVKVMAEKLAVNMVKGTIKYSVDTWSRDAWMEAAIDDATDALNYLYLLKGAIERDG